MIAPRHNEGLLMDVLAEGQHPAVREAILSETLRLVARRRRFRQARQLASALTVVVLAAWALFLWRPPPPGTAKPRVADAGSEPGPYLLVRSHPASVFLKE